ncbi:hypothetical protein [Geodermatophilus sp. SYSU D00815]
MLLSVAFYALLRRWEFTGRDELQQVALILAGVAASAVFLPELSSDLWRLSRDEVEKLVPRHRRDGMLRSLLSADSQDAEWDDLVHRQAVAPLMAAAKAPEVVVKNMDYTVAVHLDRKVAVGDRVLRITQVETTSVSLRRLPRAPVDGFFVSVARTPLALDHEFSAPGCLSREIVELRDDDGVPLPTEEWYAAMAELCDLRVEINGTYPEVRRKEGEAADVVRWYFTPGKEETTHVPLRVSFTFPLSPGIEEFPVFFRGYYCAGATVVTAKVYGLGADAPLRVHSFFARGLGEERREDVVQGENDLCKVASFSSGSDSILWPGSGVLFDWHTCPRLP